MRHKIGTACMIVGAALVLAALSLFAWNRWEDKQAGVAVERLLPRLLSDIEEAVAERQEGTAGAVPDPYDTSMKTVEIDGYDYIGYLSIPSLGLDLPVMAEWDYPRLKIAPCRYAGSTKTNDLVIAAHNYARHFGLLSKLSPGDEVCFVDMDGIRTSYEVSVVEVLEPAEVEEMTAGAYDLTLFTCTYGGQSRVTVRCERVESTNLYCMFDLSCNLCYDIE